MKKRIRVFVSLVAVSVLLLIFTSCATTGDDAASDVSEPPVSEEVSAPEQGETVSPAVDTAEEESPADSSADAEEAPPAVADDAGFSLPNTYVCAVDINPNQITFDAGVEDFLSVFGSADSTLDKLAPMLLSVANTAYETGRFFYTGDEPVDAEFEWKTIFYLVNNYAFEYEGVTQADGNIYVPAPIMELFFGDVFYSDQIPEIPDSMAGLVAYDESDTTYVITGADGGGISFVLRDITISLSSSAEDDSQSATITFDVVTSDGSGDDTVCVEIIHALSANYLYTVQSAYPADIS